jgi:DNA-binding transcriptional regulator YbjK
MAMRRAHIDIAIDELVLHGVAPGDPRVAQAVEQATRQALAGGPSAQHVDHGAIGRAVDDAVAQRTAR